MNTGKIVKQLKREAKTHPAKATVLAVLAVVAVCYWAGLAWSWVDDGKAKPQSQFTSAALKGATGQFDGQAILDAELAKLGSTNKKGDMPSHGWKQLVEWIEDDPRTRAVETMPGRFDAFETAEKPRAEQQVEEDKLKAENQTVFVEPEVTPQQLEMSLSSTLVAPGGGVALIDGKAYRVGQKVISEKDQHKTAFTLSEISAKHVTLTHKDKKHKLILPEKKNTGNIQINIKK